eukprot:342933_1
MGRHRLYEPLIRSLTPRGTLLKTHQQYRLKFRTHILDGYLDLEHINNPCFSTMSILAGLHNETINIYSHLIPFIFLIITLFYNLSTTETDNE